MLHIICLFNVLHKKNFCLEERRFTFEGHDEGPLLPTKLSEFESGDDGVGFDDVDEVLLLVNVDLTVIEGHDHCLEALTLIVNHFHRRHTARQLHRPQLLTLKNECH